MTTTKIIAAMAVAIGINACGEQAEEGKFGSARGGGNTTTVADAGSPPDTSTPDAGQPVPAPTCNKVWYYFDRDGDGVGDAHDGEKIPVLGDDCTNPPTQFVRTPGDCAPGDPVKTFDCTQQPPNVPQPPAIKVNVGVADKITLSELSSLTFPVKGVVRTVLFGTEPVDLKVRLIGFTDSPVTGDRMDPYLLMDTDPDDLRWAEWGGAASGMSGSTIILHDPTRNILSRVAGALSFTMGGREQAPYLFIATPIERMLEIEASFTSIQPTWCPAALPAVSTLMVSGGTDALALRQGRTSHFDARFVSAPMGGVAGLYGAADPVVMKAGSAIAVSLVHGDIYTSSAIGTVTLVDGDKLWAFGHPFTWSGRTRLPFQAAKIDAVLSDPFFGAYKVGGPVGEVQGVITRDQNAGIAGRFGSALTDEIKVHTRVAAEGQTSTAREYNEFVANLDIVDRTLEIVIGGVWLPLRADRQHLGAGSVRVGMHVSFKETAKKIERTWVVTDPSEVILTTAFDVIHELDTVFELHGTPTLVEFDLTWVDEVRTLQIVSVGANTSVAAGQNLSVTVTYQLYGEEDNRQATYSLSVPSDFPVGPAFITVMRETGGSSNQGTALDDQIERYNRRGRPQALEIRLETFGRTHQLLLIEKNEVVNGFASSDVTVVAP